jgi:hypothetical protein
MQAIFGGEQFFLLFYVFDKYRITIKKNCDSDEKVAGSTFMRLYDVL